MGPAAEPADWFDSHCHIQEHYLPEGSDDAYLRGALERAAASGVRRIVCIGTDAATSAQALSVARAYHQPADGQPEVWATLGLHPHEASSTTAELVTLLESTAGDDRVVGVGECGLDYFYEHSPREAQRLAFAEQITLAQRLDLTLVIHARDAWDDLFAVLGTTGVPDRTVLHCFTGGPDEARRCLDAGMFLSFSGIVTFKKSTEVQDAARLCPLDRLLVETDSPFLTPTPHRGEVNEPGYVPFVGAAVAGLKSLEAAEVAASSTAAGRAAFAL
jgi:TatD DNase family protein